jgi:hypothetical protein
MQQNICKTPAGLSSRSTAPYFSTAAVYTRNWPSVFEKYKSRPSEVRFSESRKRVRRDEAGFESCPRQPWRLSPEPRLARCAPQCYPHHITSQQKIHPSWRRLFPRPPYLGSEPLLRYTWNICLLRGLSSRSISSLDIAVLFPVPSYNCVTRVSARDCFCCIAD